MNIKNRILGVFILFGLFANPVFADVFDNQQSLSKIAPRLPEVKDISCKFSQDKFFSTSNIHIKSSGNFKFDKDKGVFFYTTSPVRNTVSYSNSDYKQINSVIKAISTKNYSKLEQDFTFYYTENNGNWNLGLKPKAKSPSANYLYSIELLGTSMSSVGISKIVITTLDKTKTTIKFFE